MHTGPYGHPAGIGTACRHWLSRNLGHPRHPDGWLSLLPIQLSSKASTLSTGESLCTGYWAKQEGNQDTYAVWSPVTGTHLA